jgi:hypothetical protein
MGVSAESRESFVDRAAMLWTLYSATGPFQGKPLPDTAAEFGSMLLQHADVFVAAGREGVQTLMDLQKAGMDYERFKSKATGIDRIFSDQYVRT